jgi:PIN domain nuclease of toxin-antitoxin system
MTFTHIFDACAVLAYANKAVGWDVVAAILAKPTNVCRMHSVNWCEVWHIARKSNNETDVDTLISKLRAAGIGEESDIDAPFWREVGKCRHTMRAAGQQMALMEEPLPSADDPGGAHVKGYSADPKPEKEVKEEGPIPLVATPDS